MATDPDDNLPLMEVGAWSEEKHDLLRRFVHASWAARSKWSQRTYVDLFCGPGKIIIRGDNRVLDGSPLVAWKESLERGGAFTDVFVGDLNSQSVFACTARLRKLGASVHSFHGEAVDTIDEVLGKLRVNGGLHLVVLDPFGMGALDFSILKKLSALGSVDIILHFSVMDLQRNIDGEYAAESDGLLEKFAPKWRTHIDVKQKSKAGARTAYWAYWKGLIQQLGFKVATRSPLFTNSKNGPLYHLVLLYRHDLAATIWNDVARRSGQKDLFVHG